MSDRIQSLEGWVSASDAADTLGVSRQGLHYRITSGVIPPEAVRTISMGQKTQYLISEAYIREQQPWNDDEETTEE